ncbi:MAG: polysaccharide deacetylase family protein [Flavobacteriaceae bacterium]|nr:polysaccharide deacetylase family protein [Flavobacteriaceae bacterium]
MRKFLKDARTFYKQSVFGNSLCYHSVSNLNAGFDRIHSVSSNVFKRQLQILNITNRVSSLVNSMLFKQKSQVSITFDDAYLDLLDHAIPYLLNKQIPAVIFINSSTLKGKTLWRDNLRLIFKSGLIDDYISEQPIEYGFNYENVYSKTKQPQYNSELIANSLSDFVNKKGIGYKERLYLNKDELKQISSSGLIELGNHSRNHYLLSSISEEQQRKEILGGKEDLMKEGLLLCNIFSVPFGGYNSINKTSLKLIAQGGYTDLLLTNGGEKFTNHKMAARTNLKVINRYLPKNRL